MEINVEKVKIELDKYNRLLEDYEDVYLRLYHELNFSSSYWNDENSIKFFEKIKSDKNKNYLCILELKEIKKIYNYIVTSYESIGKKIFFDLKKKNSLYDKFDNFIVTLDKIIKLYEELDYENLTEEKIIIEEELKEIQKIKPKILLIKENVMDLFEQLEEIEKNIHYRLSKIKIEILKIEDISDFLR